MTDDTERLKIRRACGHTQTIWLGGAAEEKQEWIATLEASKCRVCLQQPNNQPVFYFLGGLQHRNMMSCHHATDPLDEQLRARGYVHRGQVWTKLLLTVEDSYVEALWIGQKGWSTQT
jgi:hypothetical protein